jgi:iron complex transport system ATP-binding protein
MFSGASSWGRAMADSPVYKVEGLEFSYGQLKVLNGLDLSLAKGHFHGIVGPNGCGKTTLLNLLAGVQEPGAGKVFLEGSPISGLKRSELSRKAALMPQEFSVNFPYTVHEVVLMGRHPYIPRFSSPNADDLQAVEWALQAMDMNGLAQKPVTELSGGEKQRAALARALAQDTPILLLDEPTSNLDVKHTRSVLTLMERLVKEKGRTVVAIMHDLNLAAAFCDQVVFMQKGRVVTQGPSSSVMNSGNIECVFGVKTKVEFDEYAGSLVVAFKKEGASC